MKKLIFAGLVCLASFAAVEVTTPKAEATNVDCNAVKCPACPEGTVHAPVGNNCCRCIAI
jgi:hypothetical protein